ncbi:hypothetical protein NQ370_24535, partial [Escherichia coli]|nr:hypothetical protein [Escherichia coli]
MEKRSFKEKLEIVRNIIRESLSGNAAFALLVYSLLHTLPIKTFADLFVTILLFIAIIAVVIWLFLIIGNDSNLLIVFYVQIMPDDFVMQLHR